MEGPVNSILKAAREMRKAAQYGKPMARIDVDHASWPQNREAAQRFLDALAAWDRLIDSLPKFAGTDDPYIVGVHGPAPLPRRGADGPTDEELDGAEQWGDDTAQQALERGPR